MPDKPKKYYFPKLILTKESILKVLNQLENPREPTAALKDLFVSPPFSVEVIKTDFISSPPSEKVKSLVKEAVKKNLQNLLEILVNGRKSLQKTL
jgi:hypothetical protein